MAFVTTTGYDAEFLKLLDQGTYDAVGQMAVEYQRDCQRRVNIGNDQGWLRSQPGNPPHHSGPTGPYKHIASVGNRARKTWHVGVDAEHFHLWFQETGTKPHIIEAKRAKLLRIRWLAEGRGRREPTPEEISRIGLRKEGDDWVYYRRRVLHPGQEPRPWMASTLRLGLKKYAAIIGKGGAFKLTTQRPFRPEPPQ